MKQVTIVISKNEREFEKLKDMLENEKFYYCWTFSVKDLTEEMLSHVTKLWLDKIKKA